MTEVVHVITGLGTGGAETMLVQLARVLQERGISQHVVSLTAHDALAADLRAAGIGTTILGANSLSALPAAMRLLVRLVNDTRPRIIQGWMYHGNLAGTLCHYISHGRRDRKLFWNLRASNMDAKRYGRIIWWSGALSPWVDVVVANSEVGAAFHRDHGFRPKRSVVIDNGIETKKFRPDPASREQIRLQLGISTDAIVAIHVARVDPMKDNANFIAAMTRVPSVIGVMVGSGTMDLPLPPNVKALGLRRDPEKLFAAADIVASTSAFGEGFSNVIAEGMSAGLIPVATDVGDARRIVADVGWIVAPGNPEAFADAILKVAALSQAERRERGNQARERIVANFTLAQAADSFARLYSSA